jgi:uncharacterized membrane protein
LPAIDQGVASVAILESDSNVTMIDIQVPDLQEEEMTVDGNVYQVLTIEGYDYTSEVGKPQLPVIRETIGIPDGASVEAIAESTSSTYTGYRVYPLQPPELDSDEDSEFVIDEDFYSQSTFYPEAIVEVGTPAIWRDIAVVDLQVNPVQFNPATGELKVYHNIKVSLVYSGGEAVAKTVEPEFGRMYRSTILNYDYLDITEAYLNVEDIPAAQDEIPLPDDVELDGTPVSTEVKLLSIRPSTSIPFANIKPLLDWHKKRGLPYISAVMSEPTTADSVKNTINAIYTSHPELEYVLLVGDIDLIPWQSDWDGMPGDYWFACLTGGTTPDLYPEVAVGRLTVNNTTELATQITKITNYSDSPPVSSWVDRALLVAYARSDYQQCKEDIRTASYSDPFTFDTAYGASGATNSDVTNAINAGRGIVNYRGHGAFGDLCARPWGQFWGAQDPSCNSVGWNTFNQLYTTTNAHALANGNMTPVIFNIACMDNALDNASGVANECLGEAFIKDTNSAVAFLGATRPSYTTPNHEFDKRLFDAVGNELIYNIGYVLNDANVELISLYGSTSLYMANLKMYLWLGDPALELWSATPRTLTVNYPATVANSISVTVKDGATAVQNALVCLTKGDPNIPDIYTYAYTNASGQATFSFTATSDGPMNVSVTKHNYLPHTGTTTVDTTAPVVAVTAPNGGETWGVGEEHNITWTAMDVVMTIDLYYSINGGSSWGTIATNLSNSGTYAWIIPNTPSPYCRVRVAAHDDGGLVGEDTSNANFTITAPDIRVKPFSLNVTLPPDTTWHSKLQIFNDGGQALTYNVSDIETTGGPYFKWVVQIPDPLPVSTSGRLEARVNDPDGLADIDYVKVWVLLNPGDWAYMYDNGVAPDVTAGDGIYTCQVNGVTTYGEELSLLMQATDTAGDSGHASFALHIDIPDIGSTPEEQYLFGTPEAPVEVVVPPAVEPYAINLDENSRMAGSIASSANGNVVKIAADQIDADINAAILATYDGTYQNETNACVDMANTLIANGINADVVRYDEIDTMAEINNYDVVVIGSCGSYSSDDASGYGTVQDEVRSFVEDYGKGLVGVGGVVYTSAYNLYTDYDAVFPVDLLTPYGYLWGYNVTIIDPTHPITTGVSNFGLNDANLAEYAPGGIKTGADELGLYDENSAEAIVGWTVNGNVAYLGPTYLNSENRYNTAALYDNSDTVQLLVNAVRWAAGAADCPWLDENPDSGSVAAYAHDEIDVTIDTGGLATGDYSAEIYVVNNDVGESPTIVPVQLTVKPAIETGAILFDETHEPAFTIAGYYSDWAALLESWGFTVNNATTGPITYELLSDYCAVVIPNPTVDYSDAEIAAIAEYVNNGGGLLIMGEWGPYAGSTILPVVNELAAPFDMSFNNDTVYDPNHNDGNNYWPLINDFDPAVAGADVGTVVEFTTCSINTAGTAYPVAWAQSSAYTDMGDLGEFLMDTTPGGGGVPTDMTIQKQVVQMPAPEGIDAITGEEIGSEPATALLAPLKDTDAGGKVLWDLTHGVYSGYEPANYFTMLVEVLTEKGYTVDTTSSGVQNVNLEDYDVLVVCLGSAWDSAYTPAEVEVIANFVANGGGLLVMGDNDICPNENINPVAQQFGTTCGLSSTASGVISNLAAHPIFDGVTQFSVSAPGEIEGLSPSQEVAWDDDNYALVSVATGSGKVVVIGNVDQWVNDSLPDVDNQQFAENVFDWLSTPSAPPVVMAVSLFGSGRAMVMGDGDVFDNLDWDHDSILSLYEHDNQKLAINIIDWLCQPMPEKKPDLVITEKKEELTTPQKYLHPVKPLDPMEPIKNPLDIDWHELYPVYCTNYDLLNWEDNGDEVLSPSDWINLQDIKSGEKGEYHVDAMTITIFVQDYQLAFDCLVPYTNVAWAMANPTVPFWHLVYPKFCIDHDMTGWKDNDENGLLSAGDAVALVGVAPESPSIETTVDEVSWDIIVSPPLEAVAGTFYRVEYTVLNQGTATAPGGHSTTLYVDGAEVEHKVVPQDLEPGQTFTTAFRTVVECTEEADIVVVEADNYDQVDEENEDNNQMENKWSCCKPGIEVIKKVWSPRTEEWAEVVCAQVEDIVRFRCEIHNNGECCDLTGIVVGDVLSDSLKYANNATVNGEPWEPVEVGPNTYEWDFSEWVLKPSERIVIEFDAVVVKWTEEPDINLQWVRAYCPHPEANLHAEDMASVRTFIPGDANMDGGVNAIDLPVEKEIILGRLPPTCGADANGDGDINVLDLVKIKRIILGLE